MFNGFAKPSYKSTPKLMSKVIDSRSNYKDQEKLNNNGNERFEAKLNASIRESDQTKHDLATKISHMEKKIENVEVENLQMKTQISNLSNIIDSLNNKITKFQSLELKYEKMNLDNSNMSKDISNLYKLLNESSKTNDSNSLSCLSDTKDHLISYMEQLSMTMEESYNKKSNRLCDLINNIHNVNTSVKTKINTEISYESSNDFESTDGDSEDNDSQYSEENKSEEINVTHIVAKSTSIKETAVLFGNNSVDLAKAPVKTLFGTGDKLAEESTLFNPKPQDVVTSSNKSETNSVFSGKDNLEIEKPALSLFGKKTETTSNIFAPSNKNTTNFNIIKTETRPEENAKSSVFGGLDTNICKTISGDTPKLNAANLIFGNKNVERAVNISKTETNPEEKAKSSVFGGLNMCASLDTNKSIIKSNIFGNNIPDTKSNLFGNTIEKDTKIPTTLFGNHMSETKSDAKEGRKSNIFGNNIENTKTNLFGSAKSNNNEVKNSIFGQSTQTVANTTQFGNTLPSSTLTFGSLVNNEGKGFGSVTETNWATGSKLFSQGQPKEEAHEAGNVQEEEVDVAEHDPEFKPIIDLPPLIEIVHDDDQKEVLFKNRCKMYKYINNEWKERGTGDMKILRSNIDSKVVMIMRREQIHKVCCNQLIQAGSHNFAPMGNDKSVCWSGIDYSEGEVVTAQFAIKFANKNIMDEFTNVIANVQMGLKK